MIAAAPVFCFLGVEAARCHQSDMTMLRLRGCGARQTDTHPLTFCSRSDRNVRYSIRCKLSETAPTIDSAHTGCSALYLG